MNPIGPRMIPNTISPIVEQMYDADMSPFFGGLANHYNLLPRVCVNHLLAKLIMWNVLSLRIYLDTARWLLLTWLHM